MDLKFTFATGAIRDDVGAQSELLSEHEDRIKDLEQQLKLMGDRLGMAESLKRAPRAFLDEEDDNRRPLDHVLRCNSAAPVSKSAISTALHDIFTALGDQGVTFEVAGPPIGKFFKVSFADSNLGALKARRILSYIQNDGDWRNLDCAGPDGRVRLYVDADKSSRTRRVELATRRLRDAFKAAHPGQRFTIRKADGILAIAGTPIIRASSPAPDQFILVQNSTAIIAHQIEFTNVRKLFLDSFRVPSADDITWSS